MKKTKSVETGMKSIMYAFEVMSRLSQSEYEILKDLYNNKCYKDIAKKRFIAESTVRNHITRILKKFEFTNMKELISVLKEIKIFDYLR